MKQKKLTILINKKLARITLLWYKKSDITGYCYYDKLRPDSEGDKAANRKQTWIVTIDDSNSYRFDNVYWKERGYERSYLVGNNGIWLYVDDYSDDNWFQLFPTK